MVPRFTLFFLGLLLAGGSFAGDRTVTLVADEWCPFTCRDHPKHQGVLVEKAAAALNAEGIQTKYFELPWSRAISEVRRGKYDGLVGTGLGETPDFHFPAEPLAIAHHSFFTLPSSTWKYTGLNSLDDVRIGVIQDYSYGGLYEDYIDANQDDVTRVVVLRGNKVLPRLVKMLELGRIDALVAEERVLNYHFLSQGQQNPLRYAGLANEEGLYVAFSPALEDGAALAEALERGLSKSRQVP